MCIKLDPSKHVLLHCLPYKVPLQGIPLDDARSVLSSMAELTGSLKRLC